MNLLTRTALFTAILLASCQTSPNQQADSQSIAFSDQELTNIDQASLREPSGICWHSQRKTLFVVGDEGDIYEITAEGTVIKEAQIRNADFEGITYDPATGFLYVAIEGEEAIMEIDPETFEVLREFSIPRAIGEDTILKAGGDGFEALTFVPDINHSEGGTFYATNQSFDLTDEDDVSALLQIELPLRSQSGEPKLLDYFAPGVIDLSGLYYDPQRDTIFVISDETNTLLEFSRQYELVQEFSFPGDDQEGIAVDESGFMYIAQDSGGVIKLNWLRSK